LFLILFSVMFTACGSQQVAVTDQPWLGMNTAQSGQLSQLVDDLGALLRTKTGSRKAHIAQAANLEREFIAWNRHAPRAQRPPRVVATTSARVAAALVAFLTTPSRIQLATYNAALHDANVALDAIRASAVKGLPKGFSAP
jgi:hypothetical protein